MAIKVQVRGLQAYSASPKSVTDPISLVCGTVNLKQPRKTPALSTLRSARHVESVAGARRGWDGDPSSKGRTWDETAAAQGSGAYLEREPASSQSSSLQDLLARSAKRKPQPMRSNALGNTAGATRLSDGPARLESASRKPKEEVSGALTPAATPAAVALAGRESGPTGKVWHACASRPQGTVAFERDTPAALWCAFRFSRVQAVSPATCS